MVRMVDLIEKKQEKEELTAEEVRWMIDGFTSGEVPDYQMSAMLMAVFYNGMTKEELSEMTMAMVESGDQIDLSASKVLKSINILQGELAIRQRLY